MALTAPRVGAAPRLDYASYLGGAGADQGWLATLDASGNVYLVGWTDSGDFPVVGAVQSSNRGSYDMVVAKLDPDGQSLVYATYLGGSLDDYAMDAVVDAGGRLNVIGYTGSSDFPTVAPYQATMGGGLHDACVAIFSPSGSLLEFSSYLGGSGVDYGGGIALDASGSLHLVGLTSSVDFPVVNPFQSSHAGYGDGFVAVLDPSSASLVFSTYLGGPGADTALGIAADAAGRPWVVGTTGGGIPQVNPIQPFGGLYDVFLTVLDPAAGTALFSTYFGGSDDDGSGTLVLDGSGGAILAGRTYSSDFPTRNAFQTGLGGQHDGFVARIDTNGAGLVFSTYLGGAWDESCCDLELDPTGRIHLGGDTWSQDFPVVDPLQASNAGEYDAFYAILDASGSRLDLSTYLGGSSLDFGAGIALDASGGVWLGGYTHSTDFPSTDPFQPANAGMKDLWIARLDLAGGCGALVLSPPSLPPARVGAAYSVTISATGGTPPYAFSIAAGALPPGISLSSTGLLSGTPMATGTFAFTVESQDSAGCSGSRAYVLDVEVGCDDIAISPSSLPPAGLGLPYAVIVTATGGSPPYAFTIAAGAPPPGLTLSPSGSLSGTPSAAGAFAFTVEAQDAAGCSGSRPYVLEVDEGGDFLLGSGLGPASASRVRVFTETGSPATFDVLPYASAHGCHVAGGDISVSGRDDVLTAPGPGAKLAPHVRAFRADGSARQKVSFFAYGTLSYGATVAGGSLDADAPEEILTGAGGSAVFGPHVRGWDHDGAVAPIRGLSYFAFSEQAWGAEIAAGDLDTDGYAEIVVGRGPGPLLGARIRAFDYDGTVLGALPGSSFDAFTSGYGATVAAEDVDGDAAADVVASRGPGPASDARFRGFSVASGAPSALPGYDVTPFSTLYGGRAGLGIIRAGEDADLLTGAGPDPAASATLLAYDYGAGILRLLPSTPFLAFPSPHGLVPAAGQLGY